MSDSLVLELQNLAQSGTTALTELLRRAKTVATKLDIDDALTWIDYEMDGYPEKVPLPSYRIIPCELRILNQSRRMWEPVRWEAENIAQKYFSLALMRDPIAEVEVFAQGKPVQQANIPQRDRDLLEKLGNSALVRQQIARFFARASFVAILEGTRTKILNWSLALEKRGVLGQGMTFNDAEKRQAATLPFRINDVDTVVLFLSANPDPASPLDVEKEQNRIVKVRNGSRYQAKIRVESLPDLDLPEFAKSLRLHAPTVVHFAGHGAADGSISMRDENHNKHKMRPKGLARLLALEKKTIRLVVLNACYSSALADVLTSDLDCVVGMTDQVSDHAAILFAQVFYGALFDGRSVGESFATSSASVEARYHEEADVPVLKTRAGVDAARVRLFY